MMRKQVFFVFLVFVHLFTNQSFAQDASQANNGETRYISDDLFTYIHAGPGRNYRILGSVTAGTKVTLLQVDKENNFAQVVDDKNRKGWIDNDFINPERSVRELVPGLQQKVEKTQQVLLQEQANNDQLNQQIQQLTSDIKTLKKQLASSQAAHTDVKQTLENYDQSAQMEWFTRGGILAVVSLLVGIFITYLPKKRRRNDNWM